VADSFLDGRGGNDIYYQQTTAFHTTLSYTLLNAADPTGGNGSDQINGFHIGNAVTDSGATIIDLSQLFANSPTLPVLAGYVDSDGVFKLDYATDPNGVGSGGISDYLRVAYDGTNTTISVDLDGTGTNFGTLLTLVGVDTSLDQLVQNGQIIVGSGSSISAVSADLSLGLTTDAVDYTIDSGQQTIISSASAATVHFTNSAGNTGELVLDDATHFTGTIVGFAGDGTVANSDLIDLTNVQFSSVVTGNTTYVDHGDGTGTLTLNDANHNALASLTLQGSYQLGNFVLQSDSNGGTLVIDPPVQANTPAATTGATGNTSSTTTDAAATHSLHTHGLHTMLHLADLVTPPANAASTGIVQSLTVPGANGKPVQIDLSQAPAAPAAQAATAQAAGQTSGAHTFAHAIEHQSGVGASNNHADLLHQHAHHG
jgi:hypothetical protein